MRSEKYISYIRNRIIILCAALVIVCVSFGVSYSNFVYNSKEHRAVEMFVNKLNYILKINNTEMTVVNVKPGNTLLNISLTSKNGIDSYFKLLYSENKNINVYFVDSEPSDLIKSNEEKTYKLFINNSSKENIKTTFYISSGYVNNKLENVEIKDGYKEITKGILVGDIIGYTPSSEYNRENYEVTSEYSGVENQLVMVNNYRWNILSINGDGSVDLISTDGVTIDGNNGLKLNGALGYNNGVNLLNDICYNLYSSKDKNINARSANIGDIEKYMSAKWNYNNYENPLTENNIRTYDDGFYPLQWKNEVKTRINGSNTDGKLNKSDDGILMMDSSEQSNNMTINQNYWTHEMQVDNFDSEAYYNMFMNKSNSYWLASRFVNAQEDYAIFGLSNVYSNVVGGTMLYLSTNESITNSNMLRPVVEVSSSNNIIYDEVNHTWKVE